MMKVTLVVFIVAIATSGISANQNLLQALFEAYQHVIVECSQSHGVTGEQIQGAVDSINTEGINSCFGGCLFKKTNVINSEGKYDPVEGLKQIKKYVKDDQQYKLFEKIGNDCASVNDEAVTDEAAGCDRAKLLTECIMKHKDQIFV